MSDWWKQAVIYQIYPRSYLDTNGNGIGDLRGIIKKINYISDLGVDAIWLSPFFVSPMNDMGYDVSNYNAIDPLFGTMEDFEELLEVVHFNKLKLIIDQVLSHSSDQHEAFINSKKSKESEKSDWYVWADAKEDGSPPNNWLSVFGGSAWEWEPLRGQYYLHNFLPSQPDFNFHNEEVQEFLLNSVKFWLEKGVDGFRLDTVNYYFHDQQLRDNPKSPKKFKRPPINTYYLQNQVYSINQLENLEFLEKFRKLLDSFPQKTSVGEVGDSHRAINIMKDYTQESRLHMAYSFELLGNQFSASFIQRTLEEFYEDGNKGWPCWSFSNHDVKRHLSRWDIKESQKFAKLTCAILLTLKGTPCLYQGEELGQTETILEFEELTDPPGIRFWPENKGRDGCRTPMTWNQDDMYAGFTQNLPWLPVKDKQKNNSVNLQEKDHESVLNFYKEILSLRKKRKDLNQGEIEFINKKEDILIYKREYEGSKSVCIFNLNNEPCLIRDFEVVDDEILIHSNVKCSDNQIELNEYGFIIFSGDL